MANKKRISIIQDQQNSEEQDTIVTSANVDVVAPTRHTEKVVSRVDPTAQLIQHSTAYNMSKFVNHKVAQIAARNPGSKYANLEQR